LPSPSPSSCFSSSSGRTRLSRSGLVGPDLCAVLRPARVIHALAIGAAIGMRAEVVAQPLDEVGWSARPAIAVVVRQGRRECRDRHACVDSVLHDAPPRSLRRGDRVLGDPGEGHSELERGLARPPARTLLLSFVLDLIDERGPRAVIALGEYVGGDLDEVRLQLAFVPFTEDRGELVRVEAKRLTE